MKKLIGLLILALSSAAYADTFVGMDSYVSCRIDQGKLFPIHQIVTDDGSYVYRETKDGTRFTITTGGEFNLLTSIQIEEQGKVIGSSKAPDPESSGKWVISTQMENGSTATCDLF